MKLSVLRWKLFLLTRSKQHVRKNTSKTPIDWPLFEIVKNHIDIFILINFQCDTWKILFSFSFFARYRLFIWMFFIQHYCINYLYTGKAKKILFVSNAFVLLITQKLKQLEKKWMRHSIVLISTIIWHIHFQDSSSW
jgi:hypothetical protein